MNALVWVPTAIVVATMMDGWAALLHRFAWHGVLFPVHRSHHAPRGGRWEANDALSLLHAPIAIALILYGCVGLPSLARELAYGVGIGMSVFGVAYVIVHDGLVHGRLPVAGLARFRFFRAIARAHRVHHLGHRAGAPFGLFFGPWELARASRSKRGARSHTEPAHDALATA